MCISDMNITFGLFCWLFSRLERLFCLWEHNLQKKTGKFLGLRTEKLKLKQRL